MNRAQDTSSAAKAGGCWRKPAYLAGAEGAIVLRLGL